MPGSEPPVSVVDRYEELREFLPELEEIGAKHDELDLLNEVLGDSEYQALGEVCDILSMQLPVAEEGSANNVVQEIVEIINTDYRPPKQAREMRELLTDVHFKAFLEAYEDIISKAYISDDDGYRLPPESDEEEETNKNKGYNDRERSTDEEKGESEKEEEDRKVNLSNDRDDRRQRDRKQHEEDDHRRDENVDRRRDGRGGDRRREDRGDRRSDDRGDRRSDDRGDRRSDEGRRERRSYGSYYPPAPVFDQYRENQRFVILKKTGNEPLGITVRQDDNDNLFIAKIRQNSLADKQSRLQVGDFVKEVNGEPVFVPEDMIVVLKDVEEWIIIKIIPQNSSQYSSDMTYMKACITYNSMTDRLIPYKKIGLSYNTGDLLAVLDDSDENWWQAKMADDPNGPIGLIPSKTLQEKRHVFVKPETTKAKSSLLCGMGKKKKKVGYDSANADEYEDGHVKIYEEVMLSDTCRLSVILVGVDKECKKSLKERLIRDFPKRFATVVPETSRPMKPKDKQGKGFVFVDLDDMKSDLKKHLYIDEGEYSGHWYGLRMSAIRDVAQSGRMCVLDVAPENLNSLMNQEFRPIVVFIAAPRWESVKARNRHKKGRRINNNREDDYDDDILSSSNISSTLGTLQGLFQEEKCRELEKDSNEMKEKYRRNFDEVIMNDDLENTYENLVGFLEDITSRGKRWVPKKYA